MLFCLFYPVDSSVFIIQEAQTFSIRRTVHHKPHRNMGNLRPVAGQPQYSMFARSKYGGDCAAIEQYVLHSLQNAVAKLHKFLRISRIVQ